MMSGFPPSKSAVGANRLMSGLFSRSIPQTAPTLVLLAGQLGAAPGRTIQRIQEQYPERFALLAIDIVGALQNDTRWTDSVSDSEPLSASDLLQDALVHAREHRLSVLLEGTFPSSEAVLAVAARFADAGYRVRLVAVGVRSDESLLAATSYYLRQVRSGNSRSFVTTSRHQRSFAALSELVDAAEASSAVHRISIVDRDGSWCFDTDDGDSGALGALRHAQSERMSSLESAQWLSELRRVTAYARSLRTMPNLLAESLVALHDMALRRVVPELPVPEGSVVVRVQHQYHAAELVALNAALARRVRDVDVAAPTVAPQAPSHDSVER